MANGIVIFHQFVDVALHVCELREEPNTCRSRSSNDAMRTLSQKRWQTVQLHYPPVSRSLELHFTRTRRTLSSYPGPYHESSFPSISLIILEAKKERYWDKQQWFCSEAEESWLDFLFDDNSVLLRLIRTTHPSRHLSLRGAKRNISLPRYKIRPAEQIVVGFMKPLIEGCQFLGKAIFPLSSSTIFIPISYTTRVLFFKFFFGAVFVRECFLFVVLICLFSLSSWVLYLTLEAYLKLCTRMKKAEEGHRRQLSGITSTDTHFGTTLLHA